MSQTATTDPQELVGASALDENGDEIGEIRGIYLQNGTRQPEWAAVEVADGEITLVPLIGATPTADGVWLPVNNEEVLNSPARHEELPRQVSDDEATSLYRHYGGGARRRRPSSGDGAHEARRSRGRRRSSEGAAVEEGPAAAAAEGRQVASVAARQGEQVASTAADEGRRVASTAVQGSQQVARTAANQATELAGTAREQAAQVSAELSNQARALVQETRSNIQGQAQSQTQAVADYVRRLGDQARALAEGRPEQAGVLGDYVSQASERLADMAMQIEARGPEGIVDDVKSFAKNRPGAFVVGAAVAGFGIGRLIRSSRDASSEESDMADEPAMVTGRGRGF